MEITERKVSQLPKLEKFVGQEYILVGFNGRSYKADLNAVVAYLGQGLDVEALNQLREEIQRITSLGEIITADKLQTALGEFRASDLAGLVTEQAMQEYVAREIANAEHPAVDLSGYATKQEVSQQIANIEHPATDLSGLATKVELRQAIDSIEHPSVDLSGYATKDEVSQQIAAVEHPAFPDLTGFATKQEVDDKIANLELNGDVDLSNYYNKQEVDNKIENVQHPHVDLSPYATRVELESAIANIEHPTVDLSGYATSVQVDEKIAAIEHPSVDLSAYSTKEEVDQKIASIEHPAVDLSAYATTESVDQKIAAIEHPAFPDLTGYMTSADVDSKISQIDIPEMPDLSGLATKEEVESKIAAIEHPTVDLSSYATKDEVAGQIAAIEIPEVPDLTSYATKDGVVSAIEQAAELINSDKLTASDLATGKVMWVSGADHGEQANGSLARPYKGIQQAVDAIPAGSQGWVILVTPNKAGDASYREDVVISNKDNLIIQGFGCNGAHTTILYGQLKISGTSTRIRVKDLAIRASKDKEALIVEGSEGRHYFDNLDLTPAASTSAATVKFTGGFKRWNAFTACAVAGDVIVENSAAGAAVYFNGHNSLDTNLYINSDVKVFVKNAIMFGYIEHNAGDLDVRHAGAFKGKDGIAIKSTAADKRCYVSFSDFETAAGYLELDGEHITTRMCNLIA